MPNNISKTKALKFLNDKLELFKKIKNNATYERMYKDGYREAYYGTETLLEELFGKDEPNKFRSKVTGVKFSVLGGPIDYEKELNDYIYHLDNCISQINVYIERITNYWVDDTSSVKIKSTFNKKKKLIKTNKIFIVHGHNEEMKLAVARLLERNKQKPIILHEMHNNGKTIIEKFEKHSNVKAAIILISGDDKFTYNKKTIYRARQNVIFEMGFFIGKLGRENVIALYENSKKIEMLSDYNGVLYIEYDKNNNWILQICKELKNIGVEIDLNKI